MLASLDPHSGFLSREEYAQMRTFTSGVLEGVGMDVTLIDGFVRVIAPLEGTPAARAGIQSGDVILKVGDTPLSGLALDQATELMRGAPGTVVVLTVLRHEGEPPLRIELKRERIKLESVRARLLEPGFALLRITQFSDNTALDLERELAALTRQAPLEGAVLDLRNNTGGVLEAAIDAADLFVESGRIVSAEGRTPEARFQRDARPGDMLGGAPLVVLVNGGTASAAEIVAGALQDQRRGVVMGERTFGKGSVQTIMPLDGGTALKLTTARYYTPSGRSIQAQGIEPDVTLVDLRPADSPLDGERTREADLARHLENGAAPRAAAADAAAPGLAVEDPALWQALNALKVARLTRPGGG
jgi:carboxyl-terminal processing protease